jgi:hypothetical protein
MSYKSMEERAMSKYLFLYSGGMEPGDDQAANQAEMKAWETWLTGLGKAVVDMGNPLAPNAKSVRSDGTVADGPVGGMSNGYSIVEADSMEAALRMAKGCPGLKTGSQVSVFEMMSMM